MCQRNPFKSSARCPCPPPVKIRHRFRAFLSDLQPLESATVVSKTGVEAEAPMVLGTEAVEAVVRLGSSGVSAETGVEDVVPIVLFDLTSVVIVVSK
jgi:hypothetical protein